MIRRRHIAGRADRTDRRAEERARRREQMLDAAERIAAAVGWDSLTMIEVAEQSRVSRALVYLYFRSKAALRLAIAERAVWRLSRRLADAVHQQARGVDQLLAIVRVCLAEAGMSAARTLVAAHRETPSPTPDLRLGESTFRAGVESCRYTISGALELGIRDGSIPPDVGAARTVAALLWEFICGVVLLRGPAPEPGSDRPDATSAVSELALQFVERCVRHFAPPISLQAQAH